MQVQKTQMERLTETEARADFGIVSEGGVGMVLNPTLVI